MPECWKLTDERGKTFNNTRWGAGITHTAPGVGQLCSEGWLHCYDDPYLAVLFNPMHANFAQPQLWRAKRGGATINDRGLKRGVARLTTIERVPLPLITPRQRTCFAILCAMTALDVAPQQPEPELYIQQIAVWRTWADGFLSNTCTAYDAAAARATRGAIHAAVTYDAAYAAQAAVCAILDRVLVDPGRVGPRHARRRVAQRAQPFGARRVGRPITINAGLAQAEAAAAVATNTINIDFAALIAWALAFGAE